MFHDKTVSALFGDFESAAAAVRALEASGFDHDHIAIVTGRPGEHADAHLDVTEHPTDISKDTSVDPVTGTEQGGLAGGAVGLVAGLVLFAVSGLGPVLAAGWLVTTAIGISFGMAGGFASTLVNAGTLPHHAEAYVAGVKAGGTLVSVRCKAEQVAEVEAILARTSTSGIPFKAAT